MKRSFSKFTVFVVVFIFSLTAAKPAVMAGNEAQIFSDVPTESWAVQPINSAIVSGLMGGMGGGIFGYGEPITRAQFVTVLFNMFGWEGHSTGTPTFADVSRNDWFFPYVEAAAANGVIRSDREFRPNAPITRQDMVVFLVRALGYGGRGSLAVQVEAFEEIPFRDVQQYAGYVIIAHDIGMISGVGDGLFAPSSTATREQAAAMLTRVNYRLIAPQGWVHGFYAFGAFGQRGLIWDMDAVSFGWSQMELGGQGAWLNTGAAGGNPWVIPAGYELIANFPRETSATANLNVFMETSGGLNELISSETHRNQAIAAILQEVTRTYDAIGRSPFDGVTINFEGLRGELARSDFNAFLTSLASALRAANRTLYVTVHPSTIDGIYFDGYDLRTIGDLADRVILMAHDYHPRSLEGFIGTEWQRHAALTPISEVYRALRAITHPTTGVRDREKIAIAFSFPNIGWFIDENGNAISPAPIVVSPETVIARMLQPDTHFGWSYTHRNPYLIYTTEAGERVFLWYEDDRSIRDKMQLARLFGITGSSLWRIGIVPNDPEWCVWGNFR